MNRFFPILFALCFVACTKEVPFEQVEIRACASHPTGLAAATSFVVDGKAYVFGGRTPDGTPQNHLWEYDPQQDQWTDLGETPLTPRVNAVAAVQGDTVYIGLGYRGSGVYKEEVYPRDFWQYLPHKQQWTRLADYPVQETNACVAFVQTEAIIVGCGFYTGFSSAMYRYTLSGGEWTKIACPADKGMERAAMGVCGAQTATGRCFVGTGYSLYSLHQWYEYTPADRAYNKRKDVPTEGRDCAVATACGNAVYLFGGQHFGGSVTTQHIFSDILRYDTDCDTWTAVGTIPSGGTLKMVAFSCGGKVYFGLGEDGQGNVQPTLYCLEP